MDIEERLRVLEIENATQKEELKTIQKKLSSLNSGINRGLWLVGGGIFTTAMTLLVNYMMKAP